MSAPVLVPRATYRLQLNADFRLEDTLDIVEYLAELGVSHLYLSPVFKARPRSTHGYDVTDPTRINPEIGTEGDFNEVAEAAAQRGMSLLLDIVPNHMSAHPSNPWWRDVLENGPASEYADYFDIDWKPGHTTLDGRILLPVLGSTYGETLDAGEITLVVEDGVPALRYHDRSLPLDPCSCNGILRETLNVFERTHGLDARGRWELAAVLDTLRTVSEADANNPEMFERRRTGVRDLRAQMTSALEFDAVRATLEQVVQQYNGTRGNPASFDRLHALLDRQWYQLAFWRTATEEINYRRFFDISDLIGVRVETATVFESTHRLILRWVEDGKVTGLRIDHVDGLRDPTGYLQMLRARAGEYIVVEKILCGDEMLPAEWSIQGTTGYEFAAALNALFVDAAGMTALDEMYGALVPEMREAFSDLVFRKKRFVLTHLFSGEVRALERLLSTLARRDRHGCDIPAARLGDAIVAVTACLRVYRTYIRSARVPSRDSAYIEAAVRDAVRYGPDTDTHALSFLRRVLLMESAGTHEALWLDFVMRWQQLSGPAMAKGFEDTTLYVYNRLLSTNEVGASPALPTLTPLQFARRMQRTHERWPATMNATTTHDTKRSEDVRARLNVLSEIPGEWRERVESWSRLNAALKPDVRGRPVPDPNEELLLYQTFIGAWPMREADTETFLDRLRQFLPKAAREAKIHTSWLEPDETYEDALFAFAEALMNPKTGASFMAEFLPFQERIAFYGAFNALSQVLIKGTAPGVPDFYQGSELWTLTLVDPDNRRPVDYAVRREMLAEVSRNGNDTAACAGLLENWRDERLKMFVTWKTLQARRERSEIFQSGDYLPLEVGGLFSTSVIAFARRFQEEWAVVVAPRFLTRVVQPGSLPIGAAWQDTAVLFPAGAPASLVNSFTGEEVTSGRVPLSNLLRDFPCALLI
jgi:(1->4)-alpha-D-glucan 1-alpha-D-glucosylmutase